MFSLKLVPDNTHVDFVSMRKVAYVLSGLLIAASIALFFTRGLNFGIDFRGGIMIEMGASEAVNIDELRGRLSNLGLGDISIQEFGAETDVLIRIEQQPGGAEGQREAQELVKNELREIYGEPFTVPPGIDPEQMSPEALNEVVGTTVYDVDEGQILKGLSFRRIEVVGPKVSGELIRDGVLAISLAIAAILVYIWFRFEWQFGVGAVFALVHDVVLTIGFFSITQLEFNLSIIAALLTIVGYSLNDTVVLYDRVRENLRRYRRLELTELFNNSINEVLSRTVMTSVTTLLALLALFFFGGEVIRGFTAAMIWGVFVGTYSSIFIGVPVLMLLNLKREDMIVAEQEI